MMKRPRFKLGVLVPALLILGSSFLQGHPASQAGMSARDSAMAGALSALADDADALHYNPAGLVHLVQNQVSAAYGFVNNELRNTGKGDDGSFSLGIPVSRRIGAVGVSWRDISEYGSYREQMAVLGYGRHIIGRWALGISGRYFNRRTETGAQTPEFGDVPSSIGLDVGVLGRIGARWSIGVAANGLNNPERAASFENSRIIRYGIGYRMPSLSIAAQCNAVKSESGSGQDLFTTLAAEKWTASRFHSRADIGFRGAFSIGPENSKRLSAGSSFRTGPIQFDYGFFLPVFEDHFLSAQSAHRLSLSYWFGGTAPNPKSMAGTGNFRRLLERTMQEIEFYEALTQQGLTQAQSLEARLPQPPKPTLKEGLKRKNYAILKSDYALKMSEYWAKKDQGASFQERLAILNSLVNFFKPLGISTQKAEKELARAQRDWAKMEKKWSLERSRYAQKAAQDADPMVKVEILSKLAGKYAPLGLPMDFVKGELEDLKLP